MEYLYRFAEIRSRQIMQIVTDRFEVEKETSESYYIREKNYEVKRIAKVDVARYGYAESAEKAESLYVRGLQCAIYNAADASKDLSKYWEIKLKQ